MADSTYTIDVEAQGIGADATAAQVNALADSLDAAGRVATQFDGALEAAGAQLAEASALVDSTSAALNEAESTYKRLERAATAAAKRVEKASAAGKDTTKLQAAADAATAAVRQQADAVDEARRSAASAAKAQDKLAQSYKTVAKAADRAAEETRGTDRSFGDLFGAAGALGGPLGGLAGQISGVGDGLRAGGKMGGLITLAFAGGNALIMLTKAAVGLTIAFTGLIAGLLGFAVASDKATSKKLESAWERAKKHAKGLFEGVKTEKLVRPVESLLNLLNKNTSAGKGLAKIFETLLNPLIDGLDKGEPLLKEFFKGLIIGALKAIIFVYKVRNAILRIVPKETREKIKDFIGRLLSLGNAAKAGEGAFKLLAFAALLASAAFVFLGAVMLIPVAILALFVVGPILIVYYAVKRLAKAFKNLGKDAKSGGKDAGTSFAQGIIDGITAGIGAIATAAKSAIKAAISGAKEEAESASPSKVMYRFGLHDMVGGMVLGYERGESDAYRAGQKLSEAAVDGTKEQQPAIEGRGFAGGKAPAQRSSDRMVKVESGAVQITVHGGGPEIEEAVQRAAENLIEMVVIQLGGEPVSGTA